MNTDRKNRFMADCIGVNGKTIYSSDARGEAAKKRAEKKKKTHK